VTRKQEIVQKARICILQGKPKKFVLINASLSTDKIQLEKLKLILE